MNIILGSKQFRLRSVSRKIATALCEAGAMAKVESKTINIYN
jgi:hypothetical protein